MSAPCVIHVPPAFDLDALALIERNILEAAPDASIALDFTAVKTCHAFVLARLVSRVAALRREACRGELARSHGLDPSVPWLAVAAMMRPGDKLASFGALARALGNLRDLPWRLLVAGDGSARGEVETAFAAAIPDRAVFLGALSWSDVAAAYAAADLCVWPAVNEAYGMALLEAQAAGVPVVSCATRGVPDVVEHGRTGLLAPAGDERALAGLVRELLLDKGKRSRMSAAAMTFAGGERSIESAAVLLGRLLARFAATPA